jgi:hypothetical protein
VRPGTKASRPADLANIDVERAAAINRLTVVWERQAARIRSALDLKAMPDIVGAFDWDAEIATVAPILRAVMQRLAEVGAWEVLAQWNPDSDGWSPEVIEAYIAKAASTNAGRWATAVTEGLAEAASVPAEAPERLSSFLDSNGLAIALAGAFATEALSFGGYDAAGKSGLTSKTWEVTSKDPRPAHAAQSGQTVAIHDVFSNGLRWPGDHFGNAADNANCTCRLRYGRDLI